MNDAVWDDFFEALDEGCWDGASGHEDAFKGGKGDVVGFAIVSDFVPENRGAEAVCDVVLEDCIDNLFGVSACRAAGVDVGDHGGQS